MKDDMTYNEVDMCKKEIMHFIEEIRSNYCERFSFCQHDEAFFSYIAKHIMFFKYLYNGYKLPYFKIIISDLYYFLMTILTEQIRYMYLNERSIIENYVRLIVNKNVESDHVTENVFNDLKNQIYKYNFTDEEYSLIKSEYVTSCGYVHGASILEPNLSYVFSQCINSQIELKDRAKYYQRVQAMINTFDCLLISCYAEFISGCFHRKKALLEYFLSKKKVELLFEILDSR